MPPPREKRWRWKVSSPHHMISFQPRLPRLSTSTYAGANHQRPGRNGDDVPTETKQATVSMRSLTDPWSPLQPRSESPSARPPAASGSPAGTGQNGARRRCCVRPQPQESEVHRSGAAGRGFAWKSTPTAPLLYVCEAIPPAIAARPGWGTQGPSGAPLTARAPAVGHRASRRQEAHRPGQPRSRGPSTRRCPECRTSDPEMRKTEQL